MLEKKLGMGKSEFSDFVDDFVGKVDYQLRLNEFPAAKAIVEEFVIEVTRRHRSALGLSLETVCDALTASLKNLEVIKSETT